MRDDNSQQQQEQDEHQQFIEENRGMLECMYCGKLYSDHPVRRCCGEVHFNVIGDE